MESIHFRAHMESIKLELRRWDYHKKKTSWPATWGEFTCIQVYSIHVHIHIYIYICIHVYYMYTDILYIYKSWLPRLLSSGRQFFSGGWSHRWMRWTWISCAWCSMNALDPGPQSCLGPWSQRGSDMGNMESSTLMGGEWEKWWLNINKWEFNEFNGKKW